MNKIITAIAILLLLWPLQARAWPKSARISPSTQVWTAATLALLRDVDGYYQVYGRAPKGFENIDHLTIFRNAPKGERLPASGLYTRGGGVYKFVTSKLTGLQLSFMTAAVRGISYSFTGHFLQNDPTEAGDEAVLEGTLSKLVNGQQAAQSDIKFRYLPGD